MKMSHWKIGFGKLIARISPSRAASYLKGLERDYTRKATQSNVRRDTAATEHFNNLAEHAAAAKEIIVKQHNLKSGKSP